MRIMGIDFGTKRVGIAVSDELLLIAHGMTSLNRKDLKSDMEEIARLAQANGVEEIIVGLPLNMDGTYSAKTKEAIEFIDQLSKVVTVPVKTWDERLTSMQAERVLLEADMSRAKRKKLTDKLAAQIILQSYIDSKKTKG
ncbi:MAG: Holliday junction DNA helicase RuvA [Omnitrophica bacterium RIFCSPLOWO2_02_FULL_45_16]|nr:MAG: Holliday junction DNA helicase RuvA [Omnitrophica bacterium RIFCSPHIGHO2_02_FULL_46_20]OGW92724.1 MAG: Holliday junction DNA helicase RuvA [Omnitrophica bacterium RIFCSPLOWO2_12_FULL_45_13]OGW94700.1 MAG: Holliday junction DNA helicase RuvA [Omnitrophica bacterium RIFCSPLOWO2_01_FULL_45_24]OGX00034.1 MAG: Holliday junction DNA helicase RuvA [Omnitrophica bacterium RIFCSPLOWO2_02_FULL_45_16]